MIDEAVRKRCSEAAKKLWATRREDMVKIRQAQAKRPGVSERQTDFMKNAWNDPEFRKKTTSGQSQAKKKQWADPAYRQKMAQVMKKTKSIRSKKMKSWSKGHIGIWVPALKKGRDGMQQFSKPHREVVGAMTDAGLFSGFQIELPVGPYSIDIGNRDLKIAIEVDGCYWHGCVVCEKISNAPAVLNNLRTSSAKETFLKRRNWTVIRIWEHEIKSDLKTVCDRLKNLIGAGV